ncbi:methionine--tRNA ligase [Candidatus Sumerlaeota bacterium]|nr:methionine--tRNA ligase [Candidatus Sumerlaeota bacterium]
MTEKRIYLTTPIYYVNALPHIGHAYTTIVCDVVRRYYSLFGYDTYLLTGTDEHGTKVMRAAEERGETPQAYADRISAAFRNLWPELSVEPDDFIRTTEQRHKNVVQLILQQLYDRREIYFEKYSGLYCVGCERFYTETELEPTNGFCPDHQTKLTLIEEQNYFFRMSKYQQWLIEHIRANPDFIRPERYRNEIASFLKQPLRDLCISRPASRLPWGIPLPFDRNYVTYVWFDALVNYLSALGWPDGPKYERYWSVAEHYIAKDILKPHAVYWPTMLRAAGIPIYRHLNVHGYWNYGEMKMSKSLGNVASPLDLARVYGVDALRYFLLREMVFGLDASFDEVLFNERYNSNLADDLGNLISRLTAMIHRYCGGRVPPAHTLERGDQALLAMIKVVVQSTPQWLADLKFHQIIEETLQVVRSLNAYINSEEPWALNKAGKRDRLETVLHVTARGLVIALQLLAPVMPSKTAEALSWLGVEMKSGQGIDVELINVGAPVVAGKVLFPKIRLAEPETGGSAAELAPARPGAAKSKIQNLKSKIQNDMAEEKKEMAEETKEMPTAEISFDEFAKIDLRVARVLEAAQVKGTDKLLRLVIDLGGEQRQIVAGVAEFYKPEQLVGKTIIVVANLAPRKIRGVESKGMLLAAHDGATFRLLTTDADCTPGSKVS